MRRTAGVPCVVAELALRWMAPVALAAAAACVPAEGLRDATEDGHPPATDPGAPAATAAPAASPRSPPRDAGTDAPRGPVPVANAKRVFVTSARYRADFASRGGGDGLAGADAACTDLAHAAGLGGAWVAWLSTSHADAIDRVPDVGPWYLADRLTLVFPSKAAIAAGPLAAIDQDERGTAVGAVLVWTSTDASGHYDVATRTYQDQSIALDGCADWTSSSSTGWASGGWTSIRARWTGDKAAIDAADPCSASDALYCFEK